MNKIRIRTRSGCYAAELDDSDMSIAIWFSLPFRATTNMLGCQIYFEMPLDTIIKGETATVFEPGDICYWPKVGALCIFCGPTPLSGEDGKPVSKFPLIKIGHITDDFSDMSETGDRCPITIETAF